MRQPDEGQRADLDDLTEAELDARLGAIDDDDDGLVPGGVALYLDGGDDPDIYQIDAFLRACFNARVVYLDGTFPTQKADKRYDHDGRAHCHWPGCVLPRHDGPHEIARHYERNT